MVQTSGLIDFEANKRDDRVALYLILRGFRFGGASGTAGFFPAAQ